MTALFQGAKDGHQHGLAVGYLSLEIRGTYDGMMIAIPEDRWTVFRELTMRKLAALLKQIAGHVKLFRYKKHLRGPPPVSRPR